MTRDEAQKLVMNNGLLLKEMPDEFKKDKLIVLQAIQLDHKQYTTQDDYWGRLNEYHQPFFYADESLKNDREFVLKAVEQNGSSLKYAAEKFKKDKEIVLKAVSSPQMFFALFYADTSLQNDREIILAAVKNDGSIWSSLPEKFKKDKEILLLAIDNDMGSDFHYVEEPLRNDPEVKKALKLAFDKKYKSNG